MKPRFGTITLWIVIILSFLLLAQVMKDQPRAKVFQLSELIALGEAGRRTPPETSAEPLPTPAAAEAAKGNTQIFSLVDSRGVLSGEYNDNGKRSPYRSEYDPVSGQGEYILNWAITNGITYQAKMPNAFLTDFLPQIIVMVVLLGLLWMFLARQFSSGSNKAMSFGKSRAKLVSEGQVKITFEDVAGIDEVKEELQEIIHFLKNRTNTRAWAPRSPRGAAARAARNGQDPHRARHGGRGERAFLQHQRFRLRRDVRRRGRFARARPVRAGQEGQALPDLH
jgi:cell division protease FtsH